ncbi:Gar1 Naf1 RNA-binding region containing protein [Babesia ovata]|uniref:H/ACA ribonucleoprotein complex subunit n=1 Tax=Babesia ovata TaxID=189622 RepID=A0A2H6KBV7_9APIC|nr:Gar1 Naf1 RNA-binding region containing protein [Babesia ovata]GBE60478.1 Gar1 Naf1 RNA-binding region containing protein [Babesia ovata]
MNSINGIPIDGNTEIDDLALVMHIAQNENERIRQLEALGRPVFDTYVAPREASSDSDSDDSGDDLDLVRREHHVGSAGTNAVEHDKEKEYQPAVDPEFPIDNIRIIDTVDLPTKVADRFPIAPIGVCTSVVGRVVVAQCTEPRRVLDLGSIVCLNDRRIIGTVSDTFGNTSAPFLMVVCRDPSMVKAGDPVYYDVRHSTLVTDLNVMETASSISSGEDSDEDNPPKNESVRQPVKLKQYYNDLECH